MADLFRVMLIVIVVSVATGCRSAKTIQTAIAKKDSSGYVIIDSVSHNDSIRYMQDVYSSIMNNRIAFETFLPR